MTHRKPDARSVIPSVPLFMSSLASWLVCKLLRCFCVKGDWLPELSLQPQNSHPTFCLGPPQWPTPSNWAPEAHRQSYNRASMLVCVCVCVSLRPLEWHCFAEAQTKHAPFLVFRHAQGYNLDSHSKHKSPLGLLLNILLGSQTESNGCQLLSILLSKHWDMLSFLRDPS